jgi:hypothetical protein
MSNAQSRRQRTRYQSKAGPPAVWFVGEWGMNEFVYVRQVIETLPDAVTLGTLEEASAAAADAMPPEVLLLAQLRPACVEQSSVNAFQSAAPLTRVAIVAGSWCEGERRSGRPLVGAVRLYWHEVPAWWRRNLALRVAGSTPDWSQPGDPSGMAVAPGHLHPAAGPPRGTIAIDAIDVASFETLADSLRAFGVTCSWIPRGRGDVAGASAAIWDGGQLDPSECEALAALRARLGNDTVPIVALLDYPRAEHIREAQALGAAVVLGKPYSVASLVLEISRALQPPALPGGSARYN